MSGMRLITAAKKAQRQAVGYTGSPGTVTIDEWSDDPVSLIDACE
jgi:hypothetical protein